MLDGSALEDVLLGDAAAKVSQALQRFMRYQPADVALAGSLALAVQALARGRDLFRSFGDIDLIVPSFDRLSDALAEEFLCPHVHPDVDVGRILVQFVHAVEAIRIDLFRAPPGCFERATTFRIGPQSVPVVSLEDQASHAAAECIEATRGGAVASKHMRDLEIMIPLIDCAVVDKAWTDHRKPTDPDCFLDAVALIRDHMAGHPESLNEPVYSTDIRSICPRCRPERTFRPASAQQVLAILGHV